MTATEKALLWLTKKKHSKKFIWSKSDKSKLVDLKTNSEGTPGIILCYIKAYEVTNDRNYKNIAESALSRLKEYPIWMDLTLSTGLAGLGDLYLEAYKTFNEDRWFKRAEWIAGVIYHSFHKVREDTGYWITGSIHVPTADLFTGNTGIILFLSRFINCKEMNHELSPKI